MAGTSPAMMGRNLKARGGVRGAPGAPISRATSARRNRYNEPRHGIARQAGQSPRPAHRARPALGGFARPRSGGGGGVRLFGGDDRGLLSTDLPVAAAEAGECGVFREFGRGGESGVSALPEVPAERAAGGRAPRGLGRRGLPPDREGRYG